MNLFRTTALVLAPTTGLSSMPTLADTVQENTSGGPTYIVETPSAYAMVGDLFIARPFLIATTAVGTVTPVVSLPFAAAGDNIGKAGQALVVNPDKKAFVHCLGCTISGYNHDESRVSSGMKRSRSSTGFLFSRCIAGDTEIGLSLFFCRGGRQLQRRTGR